MENTAIIWAILLLAIALLLFILETFVPSGGLLGLLSALSLAGGIVMLFKVNTMLGLVGTIVSLMAIPLLFAMALKIWPHTPIARLLTLHNPQRADADHQDMTTPTGQLNPPVGAIGKAVCDLHPVGTCVFDGRRIECLAEGSMIPVDSMVRVVSVEGIQVKVKAV